MKSEETILHKSPTLPRSIEVKNFIENRQQLFWYSPSPKSETVSDELLVETILTIKAKEEKPITLN